VLRLTRTTRCRVLAFLLLLVAVVQPVRGASDFLSLDVAWSARLDSPPLAPPLADGEHAYVALRGGKQIAFHLATGRVVWTSDVPFTSAPSAVDGLIVGAGRGGLVAIDGASGRERWRVPLPDVRLPPVLRAGWVLAGSGPDLLAFRAADGTLVWRRTLGAPLHAAVTIEGDRVYAALADGTLAALAITTGANAWQTRLPAPGGAITAIGDRLYLGAADKFFYAVDASDGDRDWRWRAAAMLLAPVAADESRVFYTALDNVVRAVDAGSGVQKWRYAMETRPLAGPVLDEDLLILAGAGDLRALRVTDGTLAGTWGAPAELASAPAIVPRTPAGHRARIVLVTGAETGDWRVYALAPSPEPRPQPLKEIPGRPLSPDVLPAPPGSPTPAERPLL
jgi:outer membrane protein assembly factor BamB